MAIAFNGLSSLAAIDGVRLSSVSAGIKKPGRQDLVLFEISETSSVAATFTRNQFCAAPVLLAKQHLNAETPRYLLINTGNANAGTGTQGYNDAVACCDAVAKSVGCKVTEVLPFSTGVIGEPLPVKQITSAIPDVIKGLNSTNWKDCATAILTTDTVPKGDSCSVKLSGGEVTITGIAKGSGMIRPDMGTMLAFIATDAVIESELLRVLLGNAVDSSFNRITVDGDTSTNDACVLIASGASGIDVNSSHEDFKQFSSALNHIMVSLAKQIVKDGEGATKFVTIDIASAKDDEEGNKIAFTIAHSPLVKTALFASDPNWGRILAAVGRAGVDDLDLHKIDIYLGNVRIVRAGEPDPMYTEEKGIQAMSGEEIVIRVELGRGDKLVTIWTCDFSYDYVKINAEYRT